jgi:hypothetical protein
MVNTMIFSCVLKRICSPLWFSFIFIILSVCCYLGLHQQRMEPILRLDDPPRSLVKGTESPIVSTFQLRNVGRKQLAFELIPSCGCTGVSPRIGVIEGGKAEVVRVGVRVNEGSSRDVQIRIKNNSTNAPDAVWHIHAEYPASIDIVPETINFGVISPAALTSLAFELRPVNGTPTISLESTKVTSTDPNILVKPNNVRGKHQYKVSLSPDIPHGVITSSVRVEIPSMSRVIEIPVRGEIQADTKVCPSVIYLTKNQLREYIVEGRFIAYRTDGQLLGMLEAGNLPAGFVIVQEKRPLVGKFVHYNIRCDKQAVIQSRASLALRFRGSSETITVQVVVRP